MTAKLDQGKPDQAIKKLNDFSKLIDQELKDGEVESEVAEDVSDLRVCVRCGVVVESQNPRAMYCGEDCRKGAYRDRQAGKPVRQVSSGVLRPSAAQELARLDRDERLRLADKFAEQPEHVWRQWLPKPFAPDDLRLSALGLLARHGPSCDVSILGHERGSAIAEFIELGSEGFSKANKKVRSNRRASTPAG